MTAPQREYFYTVDREGQLIHDGTVLTDARFLQFFYRRLQPNDTGRHTHYPYVSPCGVELNFVIAEETVILFRRLLSVGHLEYGEGLSVPFEPGALRVSASGRLYHPAPVGEFGLLHRTLALELGEQVEERSDGFVYVSAEGIWPIRSLEVES